MGQSPHDTVVPEMRARDTEKSEVLLIELETTRVSATRGRLRRGNLHTTLLLRNALVAQRSQQTLANTSTWTGCQENNSQLLPIPSVCRDTSWRHHMLKCIPYWRSILTKQGNAHFKRSSNRQPPMVFQSDSSTEPIRLLSLTQK